jgi:UDP-3-O-[3-hydroxymyristoyl] glucosamine N-acyltransferase
MGMTIKEIVSEIGGVVEGDTSIEIKSLASLSDAGIGDISFLANPRYSSAVSSSKASAVIVNNDWQGDFSGTVIRVKDADAAFSEVASLLIPPSVRPVAGIHSTAVVADDVKLGEAVSIGPNVVIECGTKIGDRTIIGAGCYIGQDTTIGVDGLIYPNVSIRERVTIGDRIIIQLGAVIGSDGFGYTREGLKWVKIPQVGIVEIGDDVEIGANTTIDRARFGKTVIENGVKLDNHVQVAHNVRIGENAALVSFVALAGSSTVGANVQMAGHSGIAGHVHVGDFSVLAGYTGATKNVPEKAVVVGYPARQFSAGRKEQAALARLPKLLKRVSELERELEKLKG